MLVFTTRWSRPTDGYVRREVPTILSYSGVINSEVKSYKISVKGLGPHIS